MPAINGIMPRPNAPKGSPRKRQLIPRQTANKSAVSDVQLAEKTLQDICLDTRAPAAARAQAARTLLELAGRLKNPAPDDKSKTNQELTLEEIDRKIASFGGQTPDTRPAQDSEI